jgi:hypothetical protein
VKCGVIISDEARKLRVRVFDVLDVEIRHTTLFKCISKPLTQIWDVVKEICIPIILRSGLDVDSDQLLGSVSWNSKGERLSPMVSHSVFAGSLLQ